MPPEENTTSRSGEDENVVNDGATRSDGDEETIPTGDDEWPAMAQGYTPLGGQNMFFHVVSTNDDESTPGGGVFFEDLNTFSTSNEMEGYENLEQADESGEGNVMNDYRSIADQALSSLENEYAMTLHENQNAANDSLTTSAAPADSSIDAVYLNSETENNPDSNAREEFRATTSSEMVERQIPDIDAEAVKRAVASIRIKAPALASNLDKGVAKTVEQLTLAPKAHSLIPSSPLAAFHKSSPKAIKATANLSRSATLAEAVSRLGCLCKDLLEVHVIGADFVECNSKERIRTLFGPLVRWIGASSESPSHVSIKLIGPNITPSAASQEILDLMPSSKSKSELKSAVASLHWGCYHDWMSLKTEGNDSIDEWTPPDVAVAFNAGVWGYKEWIPTLEVLCKEKLTVPLIITSYTVEEAQDDADVVEQTIKSHTKANEKDQEECDVSRRLAWGPEMNPFGSKQRRETATAIDGREYRENAAWQCWLLGGKVE